MSGLIGCTSAVASTVTAGLAAKAAEARPHRQAAARRRGMTLLSDGGAATIRCARRGRCVGLKADVAGVPARRTSAQSQARQLLDEPDARDAQPSRRLG